jgi:hypothetical protein
LNLKPSSNQWNGTIWHPQERKNSRVCHLHEKSWLQYFMRKVLFLWTRGEQWTLTAVMKHYKVWMLTFMKFIPQEKWQCCYSMTMPGHSQVCTPLRPSQNVDVQCCCTYRTVLTSHHHIFTCFALWKTACQDTITRWQGTAVHHSPDAAEEGQQLVLGVNICSC